MKKKIENYFIRYSGGVFLSCIIILFLFHVINNIDFYPYDAGTYWNLGYEFGVEQFNFVNYSYGLRGYLYPFLHYILIKLASLGIGTERINLWVFHSICYTSIFFVIFPRLIEKLFCIKVNNKERILFFIICMYFFKGLILYPLSDLPALCFLIAALYLLLVLEEKEGVVPEKNTSYIRTKKYFLKEFFYGVWIGIFLGGAYYIRPIYLSAIIGTLIIGLYLIRKKKRYYLLYSVIGLIFVALPQIWINHTYFNTYSPMIQTESEYDGQSLYLQQLNWGIQVQKYETNLDLEAYNSPALSFKDTIGIQLLEENGSLTGYIEYIKFVFAHFVDIGCIYLKHFFNGMDIIYNTTYIFHLNQNRFFIQLANYLLIIFGIEGILFYICKINWTVTKIGVFLLYLLPVLLVIPTAVETRFFLALHMLLYLLACKVLLSVEWKQSFWKNRKKKLICYILFLGICFLWNSQTYQCLGIPLW